MPHCTDCIKYLPPEPEYVFGDPTAPTIDFAVHGVSIDGKHRVCLHCWDVKCKLNNKDW